MEVTLQYFDCFPNCQEVDANLKALEAEGIDLGLDHQLIETLEAAGFGFRGSRTVVIDGVDRFADHDTSVGLSCRVSRTDTGYAGSPSIDRLRDAITAADGS